MEFCGQSVDDSLQIRLVCLLLTEMFSLYSLFRECHFISLYAQNTMWQNNCAFPASAKNKVGFTNVFIFYDQQKTKCIKYKI